MIQTVDKVFYEMTSTVFFCKLKASSCVLEGYMLNKFEKNRDQIEMVAVSDLVPAHHLLRKVEAVLDLNFVYDLVADRYSLDKGWPSIDPVILVKIVFIQHLFRIKSMRQTIKEIEMNVAYRWYLAMVSMIRCRTFRRISLSGKSNP